MFVYNYSTKLKNIFFVDILQCSKNCFNFASHYKKMQYILP